MSVVAIIPARGGSKGLPGKNLRPLGGKPLVARSIETALATQYVDHVFVSTDSPEIAAIAEKYGAQVILRPVEISGDTASSESALLHGLEWLREHTDIQTEILVFLQCTSPFTSAEDIDGTVAQLLTQEADSALSVTPFHHFLWEDNDGKAQAINHDGKTRKRRQDMKPQYLENGAVYAMRAHCFEQEKTRFCGKTAVYACQGEGKGLEIDTASEFYQAENMCRWLDKTEQAQEAYRNAGASALPGLSELGVIVFDFDGVFTANDVWTDQNGLELVRCGRGDGMGITALYKRNVPMLVLSSEENPVVAARCKKLKLEYRHGIADKATFLSGWLAEKGFRPEQMIYMGNDVNDADCLKLAGCAVVPADAHDTVRPLADLVLQLSGGYGAVRELCDWVCKSLDAGNISLAVPEEKDRGYYVGQYEERPWGSWEVLEVGDGYCVKKIIVLSGEELSYQYHNYRDEFWYIVVGSATAIINNKNIRLNSGDFVYIKSYDKHTIKSLKNITMIELQIGGVLLEDDIVRIKDRYMRC